MWRKPFAAVDKTVGEVEVLHLTRATLDSRVVELAMFEEVAEALPSKAALDSVDLLQLERRETRKVGQREEKRTRVAYFEPQQRSPSPHRFWCVIWVSMPVFRFGVWKPISFSRGLPTSFHKLNMSLTKPLQTNGAFDAHLVFGVFLPRFAN